MLVHQTNAALPAPSSPALGTHCAQVGKHHVVDCGQDIFSVSTSNWGKTRLMAHNLLHRVKLPPGANEASNAAFAALQQGA